MNPQNQNEENVFKTGLSISDSPSWFSSLISQIRELWNDYRNPQARVKITAELDPSALDKFIEAPSLFSSVSGLVHDSLHHHKTETSVAPVEVEELWSKPKAGVPRLMSLFGHVGVVTLLLIPWATSRKPPLPTETMVQIQLPDPLSLKLPPKPKGGGGGGGKKQIKPPSKGEAPRMAKVQLLAPDPEPPKNMHPLLPTEMTIVGPTQVAQLTMNIGDPFNGVIGPPSSGPGTGGGIGTGDGTGVGPGKGGGKGLGEGGGTGGGVYGVGGDVSEPSILSRVEPQYSEEARKARVQGSVSLQAIIHKDGSIEIIKVIRGIGFGLEQNAMDALRKWKFRPGMRNGVPVDVSLNIDVRFNLR